MDAGKQTYLISVNVFIFNKFKFFIFISFLSSCWAFASIAALESAIFKKTGKTISLSEQQLVDCTYTYDGCQGGWMGDAYDYLKTAGGSDLKSLYGVILRVLFLFQILNLIF